MSGILGIWNLDGKPLEPGLLERLAAPIAHRGVDGQYLWQEGPVGLGCQLMRVTPESLNEVQPLVSDRTVVVFDGRLDDREELLDSLASRAPVNRHSPDPDLILHGYEAFGDDFLKRLNGDFALAVFDRARRRLVLVRDSLGVRPLHFTQVGNTFLFGSEVKVMLAHPDVVAKPNDVTLAGYLIAFRNMPPGETFFEGIHSVKPSHMLVVTPEKQVQEQYWDFDLTRQIRFKTFDEYAEAFREHFERAVRRRLRSAFPVAISVSGGLDSSSIFCMAHHLRQKDPANIPEIIGITYCPSDGSPADESEYIKALEDYCGVTIERVPLVPPDYTNAEALMQEAWAVEAPSLDGVPPTRDPVIRAMKAWGARILLTGHWGDQFLSDFAYLQDLFRAFRWLDIHQHLKEIRSWNTDVAPKFYSRLFLKETVRSLLPGSVFARLKTTRDLLLRRKPHGYWYGPRLHHALRELPDEIIPQGAKSFHSRSMYREARRSYHVFCLEWNNKFQTQLGADTGFPFLDRELVGYFVSIPGLALMYNGVPKALLRQAMRPYAPTSLLGRRWKADFTHVGNSDLAQADCLSLTVARSEGYIKASESPPPPREGAAHFDAQDLTSLEFWLHVFMEYDGDRSMLTGLTAAADGDASGNAVQQGQQKLEKQVSEALMML